MKTLVALSGGVDSSVAAYLILKSGYECIGATMRLFDDYLTHSALVFRGQRSCCTLDDVEDARAVALKLHIPFYVFNLKNEFKSHVMDKFVASYLSGETPNPCIDCNRYLKFGALFLKARILNCDFIATGHYARVNFNKKSGRFELLRAKDQAKDQSYVLYNLTQDELSHALFPLGEYTKDECRKIALSLGFKNARKRESQDICFIPDKDHARFIEKYTGKVFKPGNFIDENGQVLGRHKGIGTYTIGQRKGLNLALGKKVYVKEIRAITNEVVISDESSLFCDTLNAKDFNWISYDPKVFINDTANNKIGTDLVDKKKNYGLTAKIRYRHEAAKAKIYIENPLDTSRVKVVFDKSQRAITKGQAVVVYDGERVVGGGTII